ncbi:MAG: energy-coupling factor ABC transporter ATP-binding protein [Bacillota bacterium]
MPEFIIETSQLEYNYPDGTKALKNISLSVEKGKKTAFLGANGAGKSTLFLHFNGILKPLGGKVRFNGRDVRYDHSSLMELRKNVGIVFQDPDTQLFSASVTQEVSFGPFNMGLSEDEVIKRVNSAMLSTEIEDLKDRPTHFLSYGQKKRVSIADILAMDPQVIIFDEPTACLDPRLTQHVMEIMNSLNREGKTIIMSTHDIDIAYSWADYIYVMKKGTLAGEGVPDNIFHDDQLLRSTDLQMPWLIEVFRELKKKGWLLENGNVPRTKSQLLDCIAYNRQE